MAHITDPFFPRLIPTQAPASTILIRIMVGGIFLAEGLQKFMFPAELGAGRFARIGLPIPEVLGPYVGGIEVIFGTLVLLGMFTRLSTIPLLCIVIGAIVSTKIPILLGRGFGVFSLTPLPRYGLFPMLHESRTDLSMLFGLIYLLIVGAGRLSIDTLLAESRARLYALKHKSNHDRLGSPATP